MNWCIYGVTAVIFVVLGGISSASAREDYINFGNSPYSDAGGSFLVGAVFGLIAALPVAYFFSQFRLGGTS